MAFSFIVAALYAALQFIVTVAFYGLPIAAAATYLIQSRAGKSPPALPNPASFDPDKEAQIVSRLIAKRDWWTTVHQQQYAIGEAEGLYLTQKSEETRFRESRRGRELNDNLETAERAVASIEAAVAEVRNAVQGTFPDWRRDFDEWVKIRSIGLAWQAAVIGLLIAVVVLHVYGATQTPDVLKPLQNMLLWNPAPGLPLGPAVGGALAAYAIGGIAFQVYRKRLPELLDQQVAERWYLLFSKWSSYTSVDDFFLPDPTAANAENADDEEGAPSSSSAEREPWHQVLGVPQSATPDEIKAAYRERMKGYHSDRVAGLGQKLRDLAEEESKRINIAYDEAKAAMGFR